jgi:predicted phage terminase large subunit-like protein
LICDDTVSEKDAWSKAYRNEINSNYIGGLRSRLMRTPRGAEVITNTRYHLEDISGFLLKVDETSKRPWNIIKIPAILDKESSELLREPQDPQGLYAEGTSFWPEMQPMEILEEERDSLLKTEPHKWHALYLQNPVPQEGGMIKYSDWQFWNQQVDGTPNCTHVMVSIDTAYSDKKRADFTAFVVLGVHYPRGSTIPHLIVLKSEKGKWDWPDLVSKCEEVKVRWNPDFFIIEKKQTGAALLQDLYRKGYPLVEFDPKGTKEERLQSAAIWFRQGRIWIPEDTESGWHTELMEEVCNFPSVSHDDLTDALSQAIVWYRDMGIVQHERSPAIQAEEDSMPKKVNEGRSYWKILSRMV